MKFTEVNDRLDSERLWALRWTEDDGEKWFAAFHPQVRWLDSPGTAEHGKRFLLFYQMDRSRVPLIHGASVLEDGTVELAGLEWGTRARLEPMTLALAVELGAADPGLDDANPEHDGTLDLLFPFNYDKPYDERQDEE